MAYKVLKGIHCIKGSLIQVFHKQKELYIDMVDPISEGLYLTDTERTGYEGYDIHATADEVSMKLMDKGKVTNICRCLRENGYGSIAAVLEKIKFVDYEEV